MRKLSVLMCVFVAATATAGDLSQAKIGVVSGRKIQDNVDWQKVAVLSMSTEERARVLEVNAQIKTLKDELVTTKDEKRLSEIPRDIELCLRKKETLISEAGRSYQSSLDTFAQYVEKHFKGQFVAIIIEEEDAKTRIIPITAAIEDISDKVAAKINAEY